MAATPEDPTSERDRESDHQTQHEGGWPTFAPHREIDALISRLEDAITHDPAEVARLLRLVTKEVQRLRSISMRLTTEKLARADREASGILNEALGQADSMRAAGLAAMNARLDEADRLMATVRSAFRVELRATEFADFAANVERTAATRTGEDVTS